MKNSVLYYSVAALLYCPANNEKVAEKVINEAFGKNYSLALCLEDTINDSFVEHAQASLCDSITRIYQARLEKEFYLPKLFIRVRSAAQLLHSGPPRKIWSILSVNLPASVNWFHITPSARTLPAPP